MERNEPEQLPVALLNPEFGSTKFLHWILGPQYCANNESKIGFSMMVILARIFLVLTHLTCTDFFDIKMNPHDDNRISHHWLGLLLIPNLFLAPLSFACHFRGSPLRRSAIFNSCQTNKSIILWFLKLGRKAKQFLVCDEFLEHDTCPNLVYGLR